MKILLFFRWLVVIFLVILLIEQLALGELVGGVAVIPVLFFTVLPIFTSLLKSNPVPAPKLVFDAKTAFSWFRACWGFFLALGGVAAIAKHEYVFGLPLMLMGLIFISPLDKVLFQEYKSIIPALSVRPRYDVVKVAMACWWVLASVLFIIGDSDYMSKEYEEGTIFLSLGFVMMFVNPAAAMYKNWDPSKVKTWSDIKAEMKADMARRKEEERKKAEAAAARKAAAQPAQAVTPTPAATRPPAATPSPTVTPTPAVTPSPAVTSPPTAPPLPAVTPSPAPSIADPLTKKDPSSKKEPSLGLSQAPPPPSGRKNPSPPLKESPPPLKDSQPASSPQAATPPPVGTVPRPAGAVSPPPGATQPAAAAPPSAATVPPTMPPPPAAAPPPPAAEPPNEYLLLIRKGESSTLEFKSTLRVDLKTGKPEKFIQHSVLKTLAAFLNSHGGTLVIGVEDNKNILGLAADFNSFSKQDKFDEFQKFLDTLLGNAIGNRFHRILDVEFPEVEGKTICVIRVKTTAGDPVYIKNEAGQELFYIRRLASTIDLQPSEAIKYIREHWP